MVDFLFHHSKCSKIIYYHDAGKTYTDMGTDLALMKKHFEIVKRSDYYFVDHISEGKNQIMVCFDDGWAGLYDQRMFFINQGIKPMVFIAVDLIGKEGYLTISQIKELKSLGFSFECHTWTHTGLPDHSGKDLLHEVLDSKTYLEKTFGGHFDAICFPQGRFSDDVLKACKKAGYTQFYSSIAGCYYDLEDEGLICRNLVQFMPPIQFYMMLNSNSPYFHKRTRRLHYEH